MRRRVSKSEAASKPTRGPSARTPPAETPLAETLPAQAITAGKAIVEPAPGKRKTATSKPKYAPSQRKTAKKAAPKRRVKAAPPVIRYVPGRLIDGEDALREATAGLLALDAELIGRLIEIGGAPPLRRREPSFAGLAAIIVSQQVSVASANAIFGRLESRLAPLCADTLLGADDEALRACGLSAPKTRALRALARAVAHEGLDLAGLAARDALEAHRALVEVSGVGPWTADIFLLFCVGHPDAFPEHDLALQEAARLALELKVRPDARGLAAIAERWRPFRGVAARLLWGYYRAVKERSGMALADASR